jgi:hypothetical protein
MRLSSVGLRAWEFPPWAKAELETTMRLETSNGDKEKEVGRISDLGFG